MGGIYSNLWITMCIATYFFILMGFYGKTDLNTANMSVEIMMVVEEIFLVIGLMWFFEIGVSLNSFVRQDIRINSKYFKIGLIGVVIVSTIDVFTSLLDEDFAIQIILNLLIMLYSFYGTYFIAKNLVMCETEKEQTFLGYASEFFCVLFLPLGIWSIQPRINKIFTERST